MRDNVETLYGAIDDGAIAIRIPERAKKELEAYLDCGLLCRGFARLRCESCDESRLVAFSCKGRGFCPSCLGRRMCATAANLIEDVLPEVALRQWGAHHAASREALLRYVLRPPIAQERVELQQDGLVRLSLKRAFADGTVAVDMAPLSLLCRLAASVPPPRFHTVKYAGVLASASRPRWRAS
ncbi:transposase zinc-binding domain-containing protein [Sorangium sp. So ce887]|uniref:transposase zinc-binding domain-containing protein n=1 Tax=Sorangium sp. So ce887 TaxID=3133324 RepID=UPI003F5DF6B1